MVLNNISTMSYSQSSTSNTNIITFHTNNSYATLAAGWETASQQAVREGRSTIPPEFLPHAIWIDLWNRNIVRCSWSGVQVFMNPMPPQQAASTPSQQAASTVPSQNQPSNQSASSSMSRPRPVSTFASASASTSTSTSPAAVVISDDDGNNAFFATHNSGRRGRSRQRRDQNSRGIVRGSSGSSGTRRGSGSRRRARSADHVAQGRNRRQQQTRYPAFPGIPNDVRNVDLQARVSIKTYWLLNENILMISTFYQLTGDNKRQFTDALKSVFLKTRSLQMVDSHDISLVEAYAQGIFGEELSAP